MKNNKSSITTSSSRPTLFTSALCLILSSSYALSALTIDFNFTLATNPFNEVGDTELSAANRTIFEDAGTFWENAITGTQNGEDRTVLIHASAFDEGASGGGITLGSAGPRTVSLSTGLAGQFALVSSGAARFNINAAAVGAGGLLDPATIRHEMGHILGVGTLWDTTTIAPPLFILTQNVYADDSGRYTGAKGLLAYQQEFDPAATFVPVELDGGPGTANGHLNEVTDNFAIENQLGFDTDPGDEDAPPTVRFGVNAGRSLDDALMTGVLSGSAYLSDTTLGSLQDIGYTTINFRSIDPSSVPEPSSLIISLAGMGLLVVRRRRNQKP